MEFSHGAGCACKFGPDELAHVLRHLHTLPPVAHKDLMVGIERSDDAGVYRLSDDLSLVQTVDFFTPVVNEAFDWGRIAAANALSDVYAMGGKPLTALQIVGWPRDLLPLDLLADVLEGGASILAQAECTLVGGHTVDDPEPKYGMAITGLVHPEDLVTNSGARPGDRIVLTKPIGTGIISTAIKFGKATDEQRDASVASMIELNVGAAAAMRRVGVNAATDVTGFGLLGHLGEMIRGAGLSARIEATAVPLLPGIRDLVTAGIVPSGTRRNLESARRFSTLVDLEEPDELILADAQTSGGLLIAVDPPLEGALFQAMAEESVEAVAIGKFVEKSFEHGPSGCVEVVG